MARKKTGPTAPSHLETATKAWWTAINAEFELEDHHQRLLTLACESWDRCVEARKILARDGLTYNDRFGQPKARPEVAIERDSRVAFARLLREINLDGVEPPESSRPPRIGGQRH